MHFNTSGARLALALAGLGALALGGVREAAASPAVVRFVDTTTEGENTRFHYELELTANEFFRTGDFFTIYDFSNIVSVTAAPNFDFTIQNLGVTPDNVTPDDAAGVSNVTFTNTGGTIGTGGAEVIPGFSILSSSNVQRLDFYTAQSGQDVPDFGVQTVSSIGQGVVVAGAPQEVIPEPGTLALAATGLLPLAGAVARKRRRSA
jgi:hypothetical protein